MPGRRCDADDDASSMQEHGVLAATHPALAAMEVQLGRRLGVLPEKGKRILLPGCCQWLEIRKPASRVLSKRGLCPCQQVRRADLMPASMLVRPRCFS